MCAKKSHKNYATHMQRGFSKPNVCSKIKPQWKKFNQRERLKYKVDAKKTWMKGMHMQNERAEIGGTLPAKKGEIRKKIVWKEGERHKKCIHGRRKLA